MSNVEQLRAAFAEKLTSAGSMHAAFVKSVLLAYKAWLHDGRSQASKAASWRVRRFEMFLTADGAEVTSEQIVAAFESGEAVFVHCRADGHNSTGLMLNGEHYDTRGDCYSMWDDRWTTSPTCLRDCLDVAQA